jgi:hypothetical protein
MRTGEGTRSRTGQSTVEYALVLLAFLGMLVCLGLLWHEARDGSLVRLASEAASHGLDEGLTLAEIQDLVLY